MLSPFPTRFVWFLADDGLESIHTGEMRPPSLVKLMQQSGGKPFAIPMIDRYIVFVADRKQAEQLEHESPYNLSMEEALHELAFTEPILSNHKISPERNGSVGIGVLKRKLRSHIPVMSEAFQARVEEAVALEMKSSDTSRPSGQPEVYENMMRFFWDCARAFPVLNFTPTFLLPDPKPVRCHALPSSRPITLTIIMTQAHMVQWTAEATRIRDAADVARMALGLVFASAFQVPMVSIVPATCGLLTLMKVAPMLQLAQSSLYRICMHPEYFDQLRAEACGSRGLSFDNNNREMPYMDSFIKESARLGPGPILSVPRKVMSRYTSPDNVIVPTGNWVAVPQLPLMRDPKIWPGGGNFDGFRFVQDGQSSSRLTHPSLEFPFWGSIRHACPARFYVSVVVKMVLAHLLVDYEFRLEDPSVRPFFSFGKARLPNPFMSMLVRKRATAENSR
ncbi:MAG: hypothetical protein Q9216_004341 [Gyalolechia sp. 2 TL-2023]